MIENILTSIKDLGSGFMNWHFWGYLGWQDIRLRYRRATLGPFWVTLSMAIFVLALGAIYGKLFNMEVGVYLPYLTAGYLIWFYISTIVNEGCTVFIEAESYLKDAKIPLSIFIGRVIYRNFLIFLHNALVFVAIMIIFHVKINWNILLVMPALLLIILNAGWIVLLLGIISARFRDIAPVIQSLVQVLFFVTPIVWMPQTIGAAHHYIVKYNLLNYFLTAVREPLLGRSPSASVWLVLIITLAIGSLITFTLFTLKRKSIVYWL